MTEQIDRVGKEAPRQCAPEKRSRIEILRAFRGCAGGDGSAGQTVDLFCHGPLGWTLVPFQRPDRTLLVYEVHVEPKFHVPTGVQREIMRRKVPTLFKRLRKVVKKM